FELTQPVAGAEGGFGPFHRQVVGAVRKLLTARVDQRVVVAAPQADDDLAGDRRGEEALEGHPQAQRLRVEPPAFVEQAAEPISEGAVLLDRRLVVYGGDEALVG